MTDIEIWITIIVMALETIIFGMLFFTGLRLWFQ